MIVSAYEFADGVELAPDSIAAAAARGARWRPAGPANRDGVRPGGDASMTPVAVAKIFAAKGRPVGPPA